MSHHNILRRFKPRYSYRKSKKMKDSYADSPLRGKFKIVKLKIQNKKSVYIRLFRVIAKPVVKTERNFSLAL